MPQLSIMQSKLQTDFSSFANNERMAAENMATAFDSYCKSIINVAGGGFSAMPGIDILKIELEKIFKSQPQIKSQLASDIATAFDNCFKTLLTTFQTAPPTPILSVLLPKLQILFNKFSNSGTDFGREFAEAIDKSVRTSTIVGMLPTSPPAPFSGPPL